jgi:hypothetical protein
LRLISWLNLARNEHVETQDGTRTSVALLQDRPSRRSRLFTTLALVLALVFVVPALGFGRAIEDCLCDPFLEGCWLRGSINVFSRVAAAA